MIQAAKGASVTAAKKIDSKGRLLLGEELAGTTVLVEKRENGEYVVRPAVVIPVRERWLFENNDAMNSVLTGLKEAREQKVVKSPAFAKKKTWKKKLKD